ncbi:MAG: phospholipase D-like domain-containing protein [Candidatus Delongbacteria bacterium]
MKHMLKVLALAVLALSGQVAAQMADHPVISELRFYEVSGINEEFVEIHNPTAAAVDVGGWKIQYKSATGTTWQDKQTLPAGQLLLPGRYLLYGGTAVVPAPDFATGVAPGLGNSGGHVRLVNAQSATIDRVAWLTGDTPEGTVISVAHARGGSYERKAFETSTAAGMAPGGADALEGNGWDANNNAADFVTHDTAGTCSPQNSASPAEPDVPLEDGSGTATISPDLVTTPDPVDVSITVTGEDYVLTIVEVVLPEGWEAASVAVEGAGFEGGTFTSSNGVLRVEGAQVSDLNDGTFTLSAVSHPMATSAYTFVVRTAVEGGTPTPITQSPAIQVLGDPIPCSALRENGIDGLPLLLGQTVVVRGVITADTQQGVAVYMQDETGGLVCYSSTLSAAVNVGDDVTVMGTVTHFNGLVELTPATLMETHATGVVVEPTVVTCAQVMGQGAAGEPYEGLLLRIDGITVDGTGSWAGNTNYNISDASGASQMRISSTCELVGTPIPTGAFDLIALCSQYDFSSPYHSGYQLLPRFASDQIQLVGPGITGGPFESEHQTDSVHLEWTTQSDGSTICVWGGVDGVPLDSVEQEDFTTQHGFTITGLEPGTPYWARVGSRNQTGLSMGSDYWFSTVSQGSPGTLEILFTQDAETGYATEGNEAQDEMENQIPIRLNALIDAAQTSIDCAIYSLNISSVATALINAHDRGVAVRFIYDADHSQPEVNQLVNAGITVIDNSFGQHSSTNIQHNKFMVFEAADDDPANDVVWTGSVNLIDQPSDNGIHAKDNAILIADQAVARAYTLEFNEMWGSAGMTPNSATSYFGENKTNNTPHYFLVGGTPVEIWFSHGDNVSQRIVNYLGTADHSVYFCIFSFSRNEIGYGMRDAHERGAVVRGVFDTQGDEFSEWTTLQAFGADIFVTGGSGVLHHKYMVLDSEQPESDPVVIAGSYNWSNSAEDGNNENTVVMHSAAIANQYLQEFAARYHEAGGTADFSDLAEPSLRPQAVRIAGAHPNPFNPATTLEVVLPEAGPLTLSVYDLAGRLVARQQLDWAPAGLSTRRLDLGGHASGLYVVTAEHARGADSAKLLLVK